MRSMQSICLGHIIDLWIKFVCPKHRTYLHVLPQNMWVLGFFHDSSLLFSPGKSYFMVEESLPVRERVCVLGRRRRRKKPKEPLPHGQDSNQRQQSFKPNVLSTRPWCPSHQLGKLKMATWMIRLLKFQHRVKFNRIGSKIDATVG